MSHSVEHLRKIIAQLRAPGGCPWDREQTAETLRPSLIEEAYEVLDAITRSHDEDLKEELGDLLINIMMQAQIASELDRFDFDSIALTAAEKLVRRHPHVYAEAAEISSAQVLDKWEQIKRVERLGKSLDALKDVPVESILDGVARAFPALIRAQKIQKKAAMVGFDWKYPDDVFEKVREEIAELQAEYSGQSVPCRERLNEELGDLLFAAVNLARALSLDAESSLQAATDKFTKRFRAMESDLGDAKKFANLSFDEMNALWERVKESERMVAPLDAKRS
jgi:MazG family protein